MLQFRSLKNTEEAQRIYQSKCRDKNKIDEDSSVNKPQHNMNMTQQNFKDYFLKWIHSRSSKDYIPPEVRQC